MSKSIIVFVAILALTAAFNTKPNTILSKAMGGMHCDSHDDCNPHEHYCDKWNNCYAIQACPHYNDSIDGHCPQPPPSPKCENNDKNDGQCGDRDTYYDHACWVNIDEVPEDLMDMVQHNDNLEICGANAPNSECSDRSENWFCLGVATNEELERRYHAAQQAQQEQQHMDNQGTNEFDQASTGGQGQGSNNGGQGQGDQPEHPRLPGQCMMMDDNENQCGDAHRYPDGFVCMTGPEPDFTREWAICGSVDDDSECADAGNYLCLACEGDHDFCQGGLPNGGQGQDSTTGGQGQGSNNGGQGQGANNGGQGQGSNNGGQGQGSNNGGQGQGSNNGGQGQGANNGGQGSTTGFQYDHPRLPGQCMMMDNNGGQCGDRSVHEHGFVCLTGPEPSFTGSWNICGSVDAGSECAQAGNYLCLACAEEHDFCQ